jgi:hypothetical protein
MIARGDIHSIKERQHGRITDIFLATRVVWKGLLRRLQMAHRLSCPNKPSDQSLNGGKTTRSHVLCPLMPDAPALYDSAPGGIGMRNGKCGTTMSSHSKDWALSRKLHLVRNRSTPARAREFDGVHVTTAKCQKHALPFFGSRAHTHAGDNDIGLL